MNSRQLLEKLFANWPAKIVCLAAALVLFLFYRVTTMQERLISVPLEVAPPPGLAIAEPYPSHVRLTVRGEESAVRSIREEELRASVDFGAFHSEGRVRLPVKVDRRGPAAAGAQSLAIRAEPDEIAFRLERQAEKRLGVVPNVVGMPARGFELIQQTVNPNELRVRGPRSLLANLRGLTTEPIDLSGRSEDFSATARIVLENPLIQIPGTGTVEYRGVIRETIITRTFENVEVITIDLPAELRLVSSLPRGLLKLQGSQVAFDELIPDRLRLVLDCSTLEGPGKYLVEPRPDIPAGYIVLKYDPQRVELVIAPAERQGKR